MNPIFAPTEPLARRAMAFVLAGGRGGRLMELTELRPKAAVHFGGNVRIIDFALSNAVNSGIRRIAVATQYKAHSLIRHLQRGWNFFRPERNESFDILPASQRISEDTWYRGTADAVYQNLDVFESDLPQHIVVLAGDHIYKMDYEPMLQQHVAQGARVTIGCVEVPRDEVTPFGIMETDAKDRIVAFQENPPSPPTVSAMPGNVFASMGIYVFEAHVLCKLLRADAASSNSSHDFNRDIIPQIVKDGDAYAHPFARSCVRSSSAGELYWRDVDTLDAYHAANIGLTDFLPGLDLYDHEWPIWSYNGMTPPAKFIHDEDGRRGAAISSLVAGGCVVSGATLHRTVLFSNVRVNSFSAVQHSVILPHVDIGRSARLTNVIVDAGVHIPPGLVVGEDPQMDARRFRRSPGGICLITQRMIDRLSTSRRRRD